MAGTLHPSFKFVLFCYPVFVIFVLIIFLSSFLLFSLHMQMGCANYVAYGTLSHARKFKSEELVQHGLHC